MRAEGTIRLGEAAAWVGQINSRLNGGIWATLISVATPVVGLGAGLALAAILTRMFALSPQSFVFLGLAGAVIGLFNAPRVTRAFVVRRFRDAMASRDIPLDLASGVELTPDALVMRSHGVERRYPWAVVSDLFQCGPYWIFLSLAQAEFLPRRYFGSASTSKPFSALPSRT